MTTQTVNVTGPLPPPVSTVPVADGVGAYASQAFDPGSVSNFSGTATNGGSSVGTFMSNGGGPTSGSAFFFPAIKTTSKAKYVVKVNGNTSSTSMHVFLTKDGGLTTLDTVSFPAGNTGFRSSSLFAAALTAGADGYDVMVSFDAGGAGAASLSVSVELVP